MDAEKLLREEPYVQKLEDELERYKAVARYADNLEAYAEFHAKHPEANSIELWGAAMGRASQAIEERDTLKRELYEARALMREKVDALAQVVDERDEARGEAEKQRLRAEAFKAEVGAVYRELGHDPDTALEPKEAYDLAAEAVAKVARLEALLGDAVDLRALRARIDEAERKFADTTERESLDWIGCAEYERQQAAIEKMRALADRLDAERGDKT